MQEQSCVHSQRYLPGLEASSSNIYPVPVQFWAPGTGLHSAPNLTMVNTGLYFPAILEKNGLLHDLQPLISCRDDLLGCRKQPNSPLCKRGRDTSTIDPCRGMKILLAWISIKEPEKLVMVSWSLFSKLLIATGNYEPGPSQTSLHHQPQGGGSQISGFTQIWPP